MANRVTDFIEFHNQSCVADTIVGQLKKYCELKNFQEFHKRLAVQLYSLTYSIPSTIVILDKISELYTNPDIFWKENKQKLIFQSDRKYVKMNDAFVKAFFDFENKNIFDILEKEKVIDVEKTVRLIENCFFYKRFSAFLFIEAYCCVFDKKTVNNKLDWKNGATVTSGILNVLGKDDLANTWDNSHNLEIDNNYFDSVVQALIDRATVGKDISVMETNLCAYRKLFKGSRYIGYYADRVLEELNQIIANYPECIEDLSLLFVAREAVIPNKYLGEKHNWAGIRKPLKKFYLEHGTWKW